MLDPLTAIQDIKQFNTEIFTILFEEIDLKCPTFFRLDRDPLGFGRVDMVHHCQRCFRSPHAPVGLSQPTKCLWAGVFVKYLTIDIQENMTFIVEFTHRMRINKLVVESFGVFHIAIYFMVSDKNKCAERNTFC